MNIWGCGGSKGSEKFCQGPGATVSGTATFENRVVNNFGFTGARTFQAIRFADVEVIRDSDGEVIASGPTDADGFFCVDFGLPKTDVYVRVLARTDPITSNFNLRVKDLSDTFIYSVRSSGVFNDDKDGNRITRNLRATVNAGVAGAFKILDVFEFGVDFSTQLTGVPQPLPLRGLWTPGAEPGTGFSVDPTNGAFIFVNGGGVSGDHDEYDVGVLLHEYGHYMAQVYSKDNSPGGPHGFENTQDIRLSYSEGWASFISGAMRGVPSVVDTTGEDPPNNQLGFELHLELTRGAVYTTSEAAVAKTLWDIFDTTNVNEPFDQIGTGITPIWDVMENYFTQSSVTATSMEDFWEGWLIQDPNSESEVLAIAQEFKMDFLEDDFEFESDNSPNPSRIFTLGDSPEDHTLFSDVLPDGDVDYVAFNPDSGVLYTIKTANLKNGADTFLEIFGSDGNSLSVTNDNLSGLAYSSCTALTDPPCPPNDETTLASQIDFRPSSTDLFYVRVSRSPDAPPSSGRFGTYRFVIALASSP